MTYRIYANQEYAKFDKFKTVTTTGNAFPVTAGHKQYCNPVNDREKLF